MVLLTVLFRRIGKLDLVLVPTHPDRCGGLGFVERFALIWSPVVFALSVVLAARWAHDLLYHGIELQSHKIIAAAFLVMVLVLFLLPFLALTPALTRSKLPAELEYGALVGKHGRLTRKRWIEHATVTDAAILDAPELGPVADTISLNDAVGRMRFVPVGRRALFAILVPALLPMLAVAAMQLPVQELLLKLLHALA